MKHLTSTLFFLVAVGSMLAQDSTYYELEVLDQPYESLLEATALSPEAWDDSLGWDDPFFFMDLGFEFSYFDSTFSMMAQDDLGSTLYAFDSFYDYGLSAFFLLLGDLDLADLGLTGNDSLGSSTIQWATTGEPGSQVFTLEYVNAGFYEEVYDSLSLPDYSFVNFQFRLFEADGAIELHFGDSHLGDSADVWLNDYELAGWHAFITGGAYDDYEIEGGVILTNVNSEEMLTSVPDFFSLVYYGTPPPFTGFPAAGRLFRYTRQTVEIVNVEEELAGEVALWPNPASDQLWMNVPDNWDASQEIRLLNMQGQTLWSQRLQPGRLSMDVSSLPNGTYLLRCGDRAQKLIVQH